MKTFIYNIGQLVTNKGVMEKDGIGVTKDDLSVVENAELFFVDGKVKFAGPKDMFVGGEPDCYVDAKGGVVIPAFVDPHTHAVYTGSRHDEFEMRAEGKSYLDIAKAGGGIVRMTRWTEHASVKELADAGLKRVQNLNSFGVGAVEIKSGYGLSVESEIKVLEAVAAMAEDTPTPIVPTFLGAHAVPNNYRNEAEKYVDIVINEMLPQVAQRKLALFCDVFAEEGFFTIDQARRILTAAKYLGLRAKIHADEFEPLGGAQLAAEMEATSADHLLAVDDEGIEALSKAGVTAVCLPGTSLFLGGGRYAPARKMIDAGVRVALATDLNPGSSYTENMQLILTLACTTLKMTVAEALAGATYNGAKALGLEGSHGVLMPGKIASAALFDVPHYSAIPYHMGVSDMTDLWIMGEHVVGDSGQLKSEIELSKEEEEYMKDTGKPYK